jgi:hypothetical protein
VTTSPPIPPFSLYSSPPHPPTPLDRPTSPAIGPAWPRIAIPGVTSVRPIVPPFTLHRASLPRIITVTAGGVVVIPSPLASGIPAGRGRGVGAAVDPYDPPPAAVTRRESRDHAFGTVVDDDGAVVWGGPLALTVVVLLLLLLLLLYGWWVESLRNAERAGRSVLLLMKNRRQGMKFLCLASSSSAAATVLSGEGQVLPFPGLEGVFDRFSPQRWVDGGDGRVMVRFDWGGADKLIAF